MSELSKLTEADKKFLGIKETKNGPVVDKKRLSDLKKYQKATEELPGIRSITVEDMYKKAMKDDDESKGIY